MNFTYVLKKIIIQSVLILIAGGVIGVLLMTAAWAIPDNAVQRGVDTAVEVFQREGTYEHDIRFFSYTYGSKLLSDRLMVEAALNPDITKTAVEKAMDINGYSRYWHGYLIILRPLMSIFNYGQIRYLINLCLVILIALLTVMIHEKCGKEISFLFVLSLGIICFHIVPYTLHVSMAFLVTFSGVCYYLSAYENKSGMWEWRYFLITGMCMSFFDFLTTPVTGLVLPLQLGILIDLHSGKEQRPWNHITRIVSGSVAWGLGYGLFWAEKWLAGSLILRRNVLADAIGQAQYRLTDSRIGNTDVLWALFKNISCLFPTGNGIREIFPFLPFYIVIIIVMTWIFILRNKNRWKSLTRLLPILFVSMFPYIWIVIMHQHSAIHATFWVYRIQVCAIFGVLSFYWLAVSNKKEENK